METLTVILFSIFVCLFFYFHFLFNNSLEEKMKEVKKRNIRYKIAELCYLKDVAQDEQRLKDASIIQYQIMKLEHEHDQIK